jgi:apolipoprotein N-acyltransferase
MMKLDKFFTVGCRGDLIALIAGALLTLSFCSVQYFSIGDRFTRNLALYLAQSATR